MSWNGFVTHDESPVLLELSSLQRFAGVISHHVICWAMLHGQQLLINAVLDEEKSNVEMPGPLA